MTTADPVQMAVLEAVRTLLAADPELGVRPLVAKLREQMPGEEVGAKEVREVLSALKAESEATATGAPAAVEIGGTPSQDAAPEYPGCGRLPRELGKDNVQECKLWEDGGPIQQHVAIRAERTDDVYHKLCAGGQRYLSKSSYRKAIKAFREAVALEPEEPHAFYNLGNVLMRLGHTMEAAQWYLDAKERSPEGSKHWAEATAAAFDTLRRPTCNEVTKPAWWNDEDLKALSKRVVKALPDDIQTIGMRAAVLGGMGGGERRHGEAAQPWEAGRRSAAELKEAAMYCERVALLAKGQSLSNGASC